MCKAKLYKKGFSIFKIFTLTQIVYNLADVISNSYTKKQLQKNLKYETII